MKKAAARKKQSAKPKGQKEKAAAAPKATRKRHPQRDFAGVLFTTLGMSQKEIALELDINAKTIGDWKIEDKWEEQRQVQNLTPVSLIKQFYEQSQKILDHATEADRPVNSSETDALNKLASAIQKLSNRLDASTVMQALMEFGNHLKLVDLPLAKAILPHAKEYVQRKLQKS